ncbi:TetR/AcrR family transcriptional regulator [bacterium]|nr:TetR/AcrR family transcriptional regulator [bacterium]
MARSATGMKREAILDAAVVEIANHGYYQTTVAMIAKRAGVADGTIYLYFGNKEEILFSLFDRAMERFIALGKSELEKIGDAESKLRQIIELHLSLVGRDRDLAIITQVELRHSIHFMDQFSRSRVADYLAVIGEVIAQGCREGAFRSDLDPVFAAKAVFGVLDEMATDWVLSRRNTRLENKGPEVAAFVLGGLR